MARAHTALAASARQERKAADQDRIAAVEKANTNEMNAKLDAMKREASEPVSATGECKKNTDVNICQS